MDTNSRERVCNGSLTDDLPICTETAAGYLANELYEENGIRRQMYKCRDRSFYCKLDDHTFLHALFSGHNGSTVAELAIQKISEEILLGQLYDKKSEDEIREVIRLAFVEVEKTYQESLDSLLAKKTMLQEYMIGKERIQEIDVELSVGASVVLSLVWQGKLYIANVGNCRALLGKTDENQVLRVIQLSVDHNLYNEDEILRLRQLELDVQTLKNSPLYSTRCIGCYIGKAGYKQCQFLSAASSEPIIAQPEIVGGIPIDLSIKFLVLMSSGLCKCLQQIYTADTSRENREIMRMTVEQFRSQTNLDSVAQNVVAEVADLHYNIYNDLITKQIVPEKSIRRREDLTLLIRKFNYPMENELAKKLNQVKFNSTVEQFSNSNNIATLSTTASVSTLQNSSTDTTDVSSSTTTSSSSGNPEKNFDKNKRIKPYVDFSPYYRNVELAKQNNTLPQGIDFD